MKNKPLLLLILMLSIPYYLQAMMPDFTISSPMNPAKIPIVPSSDAKTLADVPRMCSNFIQKLQNQPRYTSRVPPCKILFFENSNDRLICMFLSQNIIKKPDNWWIDSITLDDSLTDGLALYYHTPDTTLAFTETVYLGLIDKLQQGWEKNRFIAHFTMPLQKSEEDGFSLFTKKRVLDREDVLIHSLIRKFGMSHKLIWCLSWHEPSVTDFTYLWIHKTVFTKFQNIFGFPLDHIDSKKAQQ